MAISAPRVTRPHQAVGRQPPELARPQSRHDHRVQRRRKARTGRRAHRQPAPVGVGMLVCDREVGRAQGAVAGRHRDPRRHRQAVAPQHPPGRRHDRAVAGPAAVRALTAPLVHDPRGLGLQAHAGREREHAAVHRAEADRAPAPLRDRARQHGRRRQRLPGQPQLPREHRAGAGRHHSHQRLGRHPVGDLVGGAVAAHRHHHVGARRARQVGGLPGPLGQAHLDVARTCQPRRHLVDQRSLHARGVRVGDQANLHAGYDSGRDGSQPAHVHGSRRSARRAGGAAAPGA